MYAPACQNGFNQTGAPEPVRPRGEDMNKKPVVLSVIAIFWVMMACTIGYEGVSIGSDPEIEFIEDQTATAASAAVLVQEPVASTPVPGYQPASPAGSQGDVANVGSHEYSVTATNFDCTCQVDGNVNVSFNFKGDQLEFTNPGGGVDMYDKIGENTYKRSWMGYYILQSGSGLQVTSTVVEEEKHVVIILTEGGYAVEHYSGESSSPCCIHQFTMVK
jgi:hypothetical protein